MEREDLEQFINFYITTEKFGINYADKINRLIDYFKEYTWSTEEYLCIAYYAKTHLIINKKCTELIDAFIECIKEGDRE